CLVAGGQVSYWNGGYDDAFAKFRPGLVGLVEAIAHALAAGDSRFDLGPGDEEYKVRLADRTDELVTVALAPRSVRTGARVILRRSLLASTATNVTTRREPPRRRSNHRLKRSLVRSTGFVSWASVSLYLVSVIRECPRRTRALTLTSQAREQRTSTTGAP